MSRQLTFSATISALTLALFALAAGHGPAPEGTGIAAQMPLTVGTAIE